MAVHYTLGAEGQLQNGWNTWRTVMSQASSTNLKKKSRCYLNVPITRRVTLS